MKMKMILLISCLCMLVIPEGATAPSQGGYKFYFTWKNYVVGDPRDHAIYIWNGEQLGAGKQGFREVLKRLNAIPDKSTVYVFPDVAKWRSEDSMPISIQFFPFIADLEELRHVELRKQLNLIFTNKDQNGRTLKGL